METDDSHMTEKILHLTLEIIYLLSGENYVAFKLSDGFVASNLMKIQSCPAKESSVQPVRKKNKKVKEITSQMIELLTGEVPIRCEDEIRTSDFLTEEGEYLDSATIQRSPEGSSSGNTPSRYSSSFYSQSSVQDHHHQDENVINNQAKVKDEAEEMCVRADEPHEEEIPPETSTDIRGTQVNISAEEKEGQVKIKEDYLSTDIDTGGQHSRIYLKNHRLVSEEMNDDDITAGCPVEKQIPPNLYPAPISADLLCDPSAPGGSFPDHSPFTTYHSAPGEAEMFPSSECGKYFTQSVDLIPHQRVHAGEKIYSCLQSGKGFSQRQTLVKHQQTHSAKKLYICKDCGKCFTHRGYFLTHQMTHTGERPYSCSDCGRCFTDRSNCSRHQRTHSGEKPFSCSECGECFQRKSSMIRHKQVHKSGRIHTHVQYVAEALPGNGVLHMKKLTLGRRSSGVCNEGNTSMRETQ
ncbi:oocyte zinc finger protein XlCOF7.1-like isoform X2 [Hyperolius riggenbachi]|uniref:oocyte zinc finger protein XlCOF7.1-like isoform X2 n=1 Tax=Hyperolius riggenbachi TaxID=752182 RepID=UPI0035A3B884